MALNSSCNSVTQGTPFPVLGDQPFKKEAVEVAKGELSQLINTSDLSFEEETTMREMWREGTKGYELQRSGIWTSYEGQEHDIEFVATISFDVKAYGWTFRRAWYYWSCSTKTHPISKEVAATINETWSGQIRVDGYAGGRDVRGPVYLYHVNTVEGLKRLVEAIKCSFALKDGVSGAETQ